MVREHLNFSQNVLVLSLVSFLNDIGGEVVKRTIPLFLTNVLGVGTSIVGLIEGVGDAVPSIWQPLSGLFSDRVRKRKPFVLFGQILRSCMVFLILVNSWIWVLFLRFIDRSGKGITDAPRDALISSSSKDGVKGASFGLNRALDYTGSVLGFMIIALLVYFFREKSFYLTKSFFNIIIALTIIPFLLAIFVIVFFVKDVQTNSSFKSFSLRKNLSTDYYIFLCISFLFTLGNFSDGFLVLKTQSTNIYLYQLFLLLAFLNTVTAVVSLPAGIVSDLFGRKKVLIFGWLLYSLSYLLLIKIKLLSGLITVFFLYGLYYGLSEGVAKALISDLVIQKYQGTAYGIYSLTVGLTLLPASLLAGFLWQFVSPNAPFVFGATTSFLSSLLLWFFLPKKTTAVNKY